MSMKKPILFAFCIFFLSLLLSWSNLFGAAGDKIATCKGRVTFFVFKEGESLQGALFMLKGHHDGQIFRSDENGRVSLLLDHGEYTGILRLGTKREELIHFKVFCGNEALYFINIGPNGLKVDYELPSTSQYARDEAIEKEAVSKTDSSSKEIQLTLICLNIEDDSPIEGVRAIVRGIDAECTSGKDGVCSLDLPEGNYTIGVIHPNFSTKNLTGVIVHPDAPRQRTIKLTPSGVELSAFTVFAPRIEGTYAQMNLERKSVYEIVDIIGSEQFKKSGDSDAASAIKRVVGVSVVDGKYVYIRGLGGRYNITLLNRAQLPSPEPTRRVVPLDIFPTGVLKSILLKKSYTPDMPGSFAGGAVVLNTKSIPDSSYASISASMEYNELGTGETGYTYDGGGLDWLGIEDGERDLPFSTKEYYSYQELKRLASKFKANSSLERRRLPYSMGLGVSAGDRIDLGWLEIGYTLSLVYDNKWYKNTVLSNIYSTSNRGLILNNGGTFSNTINDIRLASFLGTGLKIGDKHDINYSFLLSRFTTNRAQVYNGTDENSNIIKKINLRWQERELTFNQLRGNHKVRLFVPFEFSWNGEISRATMDMPDERSYTYWFIEDAQNESGGYYELVNIPGQNLKHEYTSLTDDGHSYGASIKFPLDFVCQGSLAIGKDYVKKERISRVRRFTFDTIANVPRELLREDIDTIFSPDNVEKYYILRDQTFYNDTYSGDLEVDAFYLNLDLSPFSWLRIQIGKRWEDLKESVTSFEILSPTEITSNINVKDSYPSLNLTFKLTDSMQIRMGYSETMTYPDFLELSNSIYIDPLTSERIIGNPNLKSTSFKNYDLRWEWYLNEMDSIAIAWFYKDLKSPIERTYRATSNRPYLSFMNADTASIQGIEADMRKGLGFIGPLLEDFFVGANISFIKSKVHVLEKGILTTTSRPLQGQSPYVINVHAGYDNIETGLTVTCLYNVFGKRIRGVGIFGQPDQYEQPFHQLDLVVIKKINDHWKFSFKVNNILDDDVKVTQGGKVALSYKKGVKFKFGISYSF